MVPRLTDPSVPVIPVRPAFHAPVVVRARWLFAFWMAVASVVAVVAGLVLGILAALEASIGGDRWTPSVQAHGRLQLFGFVATFVVALAFEFLPRLNGQPMLPAKTRIAVPGAIGLGAFLLAAGQAFEPEVGPIVHPGALLIVGGSVGFFVAALRVKRPRPFRIDPQPLYMLSAAAWLAVTSVLSLVSFHRGEPGIIPLEYSRAVVEVFLRGFVLFAIIGVALRAFVGHLGLEPLPVRHQAGVLIALNASLIVWLAAQGLGPLPEVEALWRLADLVHAATLLLFTWWFGVLRKPAAPFRRGTRYTLLVPAAWTGLAVYAVMLAAAAVIPGLDNLTLYQEGGIRHVYLLGFTVPLMLAMAHVVLARFGTGRVEWENALTTGFFLVLAAWPLRVLPALFDETPGDASKGLFALAGILVMAGLALVAAVCLRTAVRMARPAR